MPTRRSTVSLRLANPLAVYAAKRAEQLGLALSRYIGILVWNNVQAPPDALPEVRHAPARLVRSQVPLSLDAKLRRDARRLAKERYHTASFNRYVDRLIEAERASPEAGLQLLPTAGTRKPT